MKRRLRLTEATLTAALLVPFVLGITPDQARAQSSASGQDPTFGTGGIVELPGINSNYVRDVAIQADGRLVISGTENEWALTARLNADGSLDSGFGAGGAVATDVTTEFDAANRVIPLPDGKIIIAGTSGGVGGSDFMIARLNADGSLDTSFGTNGITTTDTRGDYDQMEDVVVQPDGKVILAGGSGPGGWHFVFVRYNTDGSLDTSFGTNGIVDSDVPTDAGGGLRIALLPDGKFVVACDDYPVSFIDAVPTLARYNADGSLDTSFGTNGSVQAEVVNFNRITDMTVLPDGKIVVAGFTRLGPGLGDNELLIRRFLADGTPDASFGTDGIAVVNPLVGDDRGYYGPMLIQPDGKMLVGGHIFRDAPAPGDFLLTRVNADGTLDTGFGNGGYILTEDAGDLIALTMQADGKVVAVGNKSIDSPPDFGNIVLVRYDAALTGTSIEDAISELPTAGSLRANYPNPFSETTTVPFAVEQPGVATLAVFDLLGREVGRLVDRPLQPGAYEATFVSANHPAGVYYYQLRIDGRIVETKQMTIVR